ncbi:hypothetical protein B0H13DRAFT_1860964 [Mycena leptocephala]|nr:hypothetical protein B0H13DRAFT_1860964 [Mycena leptocephala]
MYDPKVSALVNETWMDKIPDLQHLGLENLQDLIIQLPQQYQCTYIIVDALDECEHPDDMAWLHTDVFLLQVEVKISKRSEDIKQHIAKVLLSAADGMFLRVIQWLNSWQIK